MSNSRKKTKIRGITGAPSEKEDKQLANRKYRRISKNNLHLGKEILPLQREASDVWCFSKDGKRYYKSLSEKDMRK